VVPLHQKLLQYIPGVIETGLPALLDLTLPLCWKYTTKSFKPEKNCHFYRVCLL
jgi:hypothetical protein